MDSCQDFVYFDIPCFKSCIDKVDTEYQGPVEAMLQEAFEALSKAEKLMMKPLVELAQFKQELEGVKTQIEKVDFEKKIKARLDVINENGDIHVLIKKFTMNLLDHHKKKSSKTLAQMGADALSNFIAKLKSTGDLK
jgi:hypothetical protein